MVSDHRKVHQKPLRAPYTGAFLRLGAATPSVC
jgi:hypothetical protein